MGGPHEFTRRNAFVRSLGENYANEHIDRGAVNAVLDQQGNAIAAFKQAGASRRELQDLADRFDAMQALSESKATVLPTYGKFIKSIGNQ